MCTALTLGRSGGTHTTHQRGPCTRSFPPGRPSRQEARRSRQAIIAPPGGSPPTSAPFRPARVRRESSARRRPVWDPPESCGPAGCPCRRQVRLRLRFDTRAIVEPLRPFWLVVRVRRLNRLTSYAGRTGTLGHFHSLKVRQEVLGGVGQFGVVQYLACQAGILVSRRIGFRLRVDDLTKVRPTGFTWPLATRSVTEPRQRGHGASSHRRSPG